jgi:NADH:ubiquinone oxidoreductase subunit 6 (subunit J)
VSGVMEWIIFLALSAIAVITAAGMLTTMSMYRAGLALMSGFVALAGLFILLDADLLAAIQIMMNVGGMLVMVLFMVMIMRDPGGEMMWEMKRNMNLPGFAAFSMRMPRKQLRSPRAHYQMMVDMAMSTAQQPWALTIGVVSAAMLIVLVIRTAWPLSATGPTQDATTMAGALLLSRYMIGFEGAAFLILAGMVGAVIFGKREGGARKAPPTPAAATAAMYTCPMHPEVQQDHPGQCPICGMDLVPAPEQPVHQEKHVAHQQAGHVHHGNATIYTCPMHPELRQEGPGQCPICGMDLISAEAAPAHADHETHGGQV